MATEASQLLFWLPWPIFCIPCHLPSCASHDSWEAHLILLFQVMGNRPPSGQGTVRGTHFGPIQSPFDAGAWPGSQLTPASLEAESITYHIAFSSFKDTCGPSPQSAPRTEGRRPALTPGQGHSTALPGPSTLTFSFPVQRPWWVLEWELGASTLHPFKGSPKAPCP